MIDIMVSISLRIHHNRRSVNGFSTSVRRNEFIVWPGPSPRRDFGLGYCFGFTA